MRLTSMIELIYNLTLGYNEGMADVSRAASAMGRRSAEARIEKWGRREFVRRMRAWGKLGGRPRGKSKDRDKQQNRR